MKNTRLLGQAAEQTALHYLIKNGLKLITQNYHCYYGEIDLILKDQDDIVFTEVRSRSRTDFGFASESINPQKIRRLILAATHFLQKSGRLYKVNSRFDVIAIQYQNNHGRQNGNTEIEWIKNAFTIDS